MRLKGWIVGRTSESNCSVSSAFEIRRELDFRDRNLSWNRDHPLNSFSFPCHPGKSDCPSIIRTNCQPLRGINNWTCLIVLDFWQVWKVVRGGKIAERILKYFY